MKIDPAAVEREEALMSPAAEETVRGGKKLPRAEEIAAEVRLLREDEGLSLCAIAKRLNASKSTVSAAAELADVQFNAESTAELTQAAIAGSRMRRTRLAATLLDAAEERAGRITGADAAEGKIYAMTTAVLLDKVLLLEKAEREEAERDRRLENAEKFDALNPDPWWQEYTPPVA